jgi:beta-lactam-binding protein with PASTA domain
LPAVLGAQQLRSDEPQSVPGVVGMDVADASSEIRGAGMTAVRTSVDAAGTPEGQVVEQSPAAGRPEATDGRVTVSVASGRVLLPTGELIGQTYAAASAALAELGLEVRRADVTQAANAGRVVALDRAGRVRDGSRITLSVAVAPASTAPTTPSAPTGSGSSSGAGTSTGGSTTKGNGAGNGKGAAKNKNQGKANGKG